MRKLDLFWKSNHNWWESKDGVSVLKERTSQETRGSYEHYLEQTGEERIRTIACDCGKAYGYTNATHHFLHFAALLCANRQNRTIEKIAPV